ncbi:type IV secretion system protein VirB4, partial [Bacillus velezensis]
MIRLFGTKKEEGKMTPKEYDKELLLEIQPQANVSFSDERYIGKGDGYEACIHIHQFPTSVNDFWLEKIINENHVIATIDIGTEEREKVLTGLKKSLGEQKSRVITEKDELNR